MKALRCNTVIRLILCSSQFTEAKSSAGCRWHLRTAGWPFLSFVLRFIGATEQISTGHLSDRFTVYARRGRRTFNSTGRSFILRADVERPNQLVHLAERVVVQEEFKVYSSVFVLILGNLMRLFLFLCSGQDHLCRVSFFFFLPWNPVLFESRPWPKKSICICYIAEWSKHNFENMKLQKVQGVRFVQPYLRRKLKTPRYDENPTATKISVRFNGDTHAGVSDKQVTLYLFSLSAAVRAQRSSSQPEWYFTDEGIATVEWNAKQINNTTSGIHLNCICLCLYFPSGGFFFWSVIEMIEPRIILRLAVAYRQDFVESLLIQWRLNGRQKDRRGVIFDWRPSAASLTVISRMVITKQQPKTAGRGGWSHRLLIAQLK